MQYSHQNLIGIKFDSSKFLYGISLLQFLLPRDIKNGFYCIDLKCFFRLIYFQNPVGNLFRMVHQQLSVIHFGEDLHMGGRA